MCVKSLATILFCLSAFIANAHVSLDTKFRDTTFTPGEHVLIKWSLLVEHDGIDWDLYYSQDAGDTWAVLEEGMPLHQFEFDWVIPEIESDKMMIQIVQDNQSEDYSESSDQFTISSQVTSVSGFEPQHFRARFFPNPVITHGRLQLNLKHAGIVIGEIYSAVGERIETIINQNLPQGQHVLNWQPGDLPRGNYFVRVRMEKQDTSIPFMIAN